MSRKHYKAIADIFAGEIACINREIESGRFYSVRNIALSLSQEFAKENPRFNQTRFLTACGLTADDAPITFSRGE